MRVFRRYPFTTSLVASLLVGMILIACGALPQVPQDCRLDGQQCQEGFKCKPVEGSFFWKCFPEPTPTPTPSPTPSPDPTPTPTPTPTPDPTPTPSPTPTPTPDPTPSPTPSPCGSVGKVCVRGDGSVFPFDRNECWTCADWQGYMIRNGYFTAGDPREDGDVAGHPGYWINYDPQGVLVGFISKKDCKNKQGVLQVDFPRAEERPIPCPTPSPSPSPTATPSPLPGGCPPISQVGGSMLAPRDCGANCRRQGYLGYVVNYTSTELRASTPENPCPGGRPRCEMPRECQNPLGADIFISLPGHFTNDLCDARSDNPFNCHHKPLASETGVTEFRSCPKNTGPGDARCVSNFIDIRPSGPVPR